DPEGKALLPRPAWAHLPAVLRRAARGDPRLPERLRVSAPGPGAREASFGRRVEGCGFVPVGRDPGTVSLRTRAPGHWAELRIGKTRPRRADSQRPRPHFSAHRDDEDLRNPRQLGLTL